MITFKLFYPLYLRCFITRFILATPCYLLLELVKAVYKINISISIIPAVLLIICVIGCYKWVLNETLLESYKKIVVKTKFTNVSWKFTIYSFMFIETISQLDFITLDSILPEGAVVIIFIVIDYFIVNFWLGKYAKLEISMKENIDQDNDIQN